MRQGAADNVGGDEPGHEGRVTGQRQDINGAQGPEAAHNQPRTQCPGKGGVGAPVKLAETEACCRYRCRCRRARQADGNDGAAHHQGHHDERVQWVAIGEVEQVLTQSHGGQYDDCVHRQHPAVGGGIGLFGEPAFDHGVGTAHGSSQYKPDDNPQDTAVTEAEYQEAAQKGSQQGGEAADMTDVGDNSGCYQCPGQKAGKVGRAAQSHQQGRHAKLCRPQGQQGHMQAMPRQQKGGGQQ